MILDELTEFADAGTLIGSTGSNIIGDVVDTGGDGINDVEDLYLVICITTQVDSAADGASIDFRLVSSASATITSSPTVHWSSGAIAEATLAPGYYVAKVELPKGTYLRYLGCLAVVSGEAVTAGACNAFLTNSPNTYKSFPDAAN